MREEEVLGEKGRGGGREGGRRQGDCDGEGG